MWNLRIQCVKRLLTDHLCHDLALRLVRYGILIIEHGSIRQIFQNTVNNILCVLSAECRARDNLCKITDLAVRIDCRKDLLFFHCIDLINDQNDRHANALELLCNVALTGSNEGRRLNQPHNCIHLFQGTLCNGYHILSKLILRLMDTRRIQKNDLSLLTGIDCLDAVSGGLGLLGCDRDLLADQMVHQGRFPNVRAANNCNKSGFKIWCH